MLRRLLLLILVLAIIGTMLLAGVFIGALGLIALPFILLYKGSAQNIPRSTPQPGEVKSGQSNTIDAEFSRVEENPKN